MSVNPSARSRCSAICPGAKQIVAPRCKRSVVVSSRSSSARERRDLSSPAAPTAAQDALARKARRLCLICIKYSSPPAGRRTSRQQGSRPPLARELVDEAPVGARGQQRVRARVDPARLVQAERVEAQRVRRIVLVPEVERQLLDCLQGVVVSFGEAALDEAARRAFGLGLAELGG